MKKSKNKIVFIILILILAGAGGGYAWYSTQYKQKSTNQELSLYTVEQGPLTISVVEAATIKARDVEIIKSEVEGNTTVLWVVEEATHVKKGDKLIELDASDLLDDKDKQQITVLNANTAEKIAEKTRDVAKSKKESDIEEADLARKLAKMDLDKYIDEGGEYATQLHDIEEKIKIAIEEEKRAKKKYEGSQKLFDDKYISETELKSDFISWKKAQLDLTLQKSQKELLINYTHKRTLEQLKSDLKQAEMAYDRVVATAEANVFEAEEQYTAAQKKAESEQKILDKINEQIEKTIIKAPTDGIVIYASSTKGSWRGNDEPLAEGESVHQHEELFHLPTADLVSAIANIHEANLEKVKVGSQATIKVDSAPGEVFTGVVDKISMMPDARMAWMNPNLKVYKTEIFIDEKPGFQMEKLRTGMGCQVEVVSAHYDNVLYVPVQAVITVGTQPTVYVYENGETNPRPVEIGEDNNRMVHILSGLKNGEKVLMTPPLSKAEVKTGNHGKGRPGGGKAGEGKPEGGQKPGGGNRPEGSGGKRPGGPPSGGGRGGSGGNRPAGGNPKGAQNG